MRNFALASISVLISLVLFLMVAEIATRMMWVPPSEQSTLMLEEHPYYGWAPRPGISGRHVTMEFDYEFANSAQGFRGSDLVTASRAEDIRHRILFLGDSFTWGNGSPGHETFVERINASIAGTEIINSGANGYGQRQQLAILDTLGAALKPDLVVLMFFWNDVEDNIKNASPAFTVGSDGRVIRTDLSIPGDYDPLALRRAGIPRNLPGSSLLMKSYVYRLLKEGTQGFRHRVFGTRQRLIQTREQRNSAWEETAALLRLMKLRSDEIGSTLLVVSIPDYELVSSKGALKGQNPINFDIEEQIREVCAGLDIAYVDLLPEMKRRQALAPRPFYFTTDRHLTPDGNGAVADILIPVLEDILDRGVSSTARP